MDTALAIVNPAAGGGRCGKLAPQALERLRAAGVALDVATTTSKGEATRLAREAHARGTSLLIAVGGDGTAHEVLNGLMPVRGDGARPCVGFLPLGTGNSFLRDFGAGDVAHALEALQRGRRRACDVMRLRYDDGTLYFLNLLSLGFVADVATTANQRFKALRTAGYVCAVLMETASLAPKAVRMCIDGAEPWQQPVTFASFCNSRFTGGSMMMAPFADTADGRIDVVIARAMSRLELLAAFPKIFVGGHVHLPSIACSQAASVAFDVPEPIDLMIDGEVERMRPLGIDVLTGAIDVCV